MAYNRGYAFLIASVFAWLLTLVLLVQTFLVSPYIGGVFQANVGAGSIVLLQSVPDGPIEASGLVPGTQVVAVATADGRRLDLTGREAILGRHETANFSIYNQTLDDKERFWDVLNDGPFDLIDEYGRAYPVTPIQSLN